MKVAGIVAEYNPFHNGHKYHIEETQKQTGADYVIAIMSGDFVQRGAPAVMDKYDRAFCALSSGCDLVLELPVIYSCASAEFFADGAVKILDGLGVCDYLSFGSEAGKLTELDKIADILVNEPKKYQELLRKHIKSGLSFPAARIAALEEYLLSDEICQFSNEFFQTLGGSNNILALEYLKSLKSTKSKLIPITIHRKIAPYHDKNLHAEISSATAIRECILKSTILEPLHDAVPAKTFAFITKNHQKGLLPDFTDLTPYLHHALLLTKKPEHILDLNEDLGKRLTSLPWPTMDFAEIVEGLKSRNMTQTRLQRALLHLILGIEQERFMEQYDQNPVPYTRILGFRKESSALLKEIKNRSRIPVITKPASITKQLTKEDAWVWEMDLKAAKLYQSICFQRCKEMLPSPYTRTPIIV